MAQRQKRVLTADDLTDADRDILDVLAEGARTKGYITDATELHRNTVANRLDVLRAGDAVRRIHEGTALYELREDPRDA
jgi:DNA-binding IclR family transcriptional regulator